MQLTSDVVFREDQVGCDGQSRYSGLRDRQASGERGPRADVEGAPGRQEEHETGENECA